MSTKVFHLFAIFASVQHFVQSKLVTSCGDCDCYIEANDEMHYYQCPATASEKPGNMKEVKVILNEENADVASNSFFADEFVNKTIEDAKKERSSEIAGLEASVEITIVIYMNKTMFERVPRTTTKVGTYELHLEDNTNLMLDLAHVEANKIILNFYGEQPVKSLVDVTGVTSFKVNSASLSEEDLSKFDNSTTLETATFTESKPACLQNNPKLNLVTVRDWNYEGTFEDCFLKNSGQEVEDELNHLNLHLYLWSVNIEQLSEENFEDKRYQLLLSQTGIGSIYDHCLGYDKDGVTVPMRLSSVNMHSLSSEEKTAWLTGNCTYFAENEAVKELCTKNAN